MGISSPKKCTVGQRELICIMQKQVLNFQCNFKVGFWQMCIGIKLCAKKWFFVSWMFLESFLFSNEMFHFGSIFPKFFCSFYLEYITIRRKLVQNRHFGPLKIVRKPMLS